MRGMEKGVQQNGVDCKTCSEGDVTVAAWLCEHTEPPELCALGELV